MRTHEKIRLGDGAVIDLLKLIDTRLLVQANSGGGKSWLLRLLAERAGDKVQTIILDNEGEFATLREKLDMLLIGSDGEIPANPRAAGLLARRLLETKVSAVVDLYELELPKRREFVKLFLESLIHLPRNLWRPTLIVIDEAHLYCPERTSGEAESTSAVIALMSQGRKRGYGGVLASQRFSKLHADARAECNNVVIGRTAFDNDQKRAADMLGISKKEASPLLRNLGDGEWFAFGPAFRDRGVFQFVADQVETTHPKAGQRHKLTIPAPSDEIKSVLSELIDLPAQAESEVRDLAQAKQLINELKRKIAKPEKIEVPKIVEKERRVEIPVVTKKDIEHIERIAEKCETVRGQLTTFLDRVLTRLTTPTTPTTSLLLLPSSSLRPAYMPNTPTIRKAAAVKAAAAIFPPSGNGAAKLKKAERKICETLASYPDGLTIGVIALLSGYRISGGFKNSFTLLRNLGYIVGENSGVMRLTDEGLAYVGGPRPIPTGIELINYWVHHPSLKKAEREIVVYLYGHPTGKTMAQIAEGTNYAISGGFKNAFTTLRNAQIITGRNTETMRLSDQFFI